MDFKEILLSMILIVVSLFAYYAFRIKMKLTQIAEALPVLLGEEYDSLSDEEETEVSEHIIAREEAFDARIAQMKEELTNRQGTVAEELHKDVENLPHHEIKQHNPPSEEFSI